MSLRIRVQMIKVCWYECIGVSRTAPSISSHVGARAENLSIRVEIVEAVVLEHGIRASVPACTGLQTKNIHLLDVHVQDRNLGGKRTMQNLDHQAIHNVYLSIAPLSKSKTTTRILCKQLDYQSTSD